MSLLSASLDFSPCYVKFRSFRRAFVKLAMRSHSSGRSDRFQIILAAAILTA